MGIGFFHRKRDISDTASSSNDQGSGLGRLIRVASVPVIIFAVAYNAGILDFPLRYAHRMVETAGIKLYFGNLRREIEETERRYPSQPLEVNNEECYKKEVTYDEFLARLQNARTTIVGRPEENRTTAHLVRWHKEEMYEAKLALFELSQYSRCLENGGFIYAQVFHIYPKLSNISGRTPEDAERIYSMQKISKAFDTAIENTKAKAAEAKSTGAKKHTRRINR